MRPSRPYRLLLLLLAITILTTACGSRRAARTTPAHYEPPKTAVYNASWYGEEFHGQPTSSGDVFDMYAMTAAHRQMPFGSKIRVTLPATDKSVDVIVNDRGPFVEGRDLDLSYGAAKKIGLLGAGVAPVRVEYLGRESRYIRRVEEATGDLPPASGKLVFTVQLGAFKNPDNAKRLKAALGFSGVEAHITQAVVRGDLFHRVRVGRFNTRTDAIDAAKPLADEGYPVRVLAD